MSEKDKTVEKTTLEIFVVKYPAKNQPPHEKGKPKPPTIMVTHYFTNSDRPVTFNGQQYIPLGSADAEKWLTKQGVA